MKIVRTFRVHTFMNPEEFTVFFGNKGVAAMRADKPERCSNDFAGREGLTTDFALILTVTTIVVIDIMMESSTKRNRRCLPEWFYHSGAELV